MLSPEQRLFESDLQGAPFRIGVTKGRWGFAEPGAAAEGAAWPRTYFWMAAATRQNAPDRYYVELDLSGYRSVPPTGPFWDPVKRQRLEHGKWPKGKPGSRFAQVFRLGGFSGAGSAFYHPYDRVARLNHNQWPSEQPHLIWTEKHTIVDYLEEFQSMLMSGDYVGV
jgi:hypothetical protein